MTKILSETMMKMKSAYDNDDEDTNDEVYVSNHQSNDRWSVRAEINNDIQLKL